MTTCAVRECDEPRVPDSLFCRANGHLTDAWQNRLARQDDGTYARPTDLRARSAAAEPFVPEWRRRLTAKDLTGAVAT